MSGEVITAISAGAAALITAVATLIVAIGTSRRVKETKEQVVEVHQLTNSRLTDMITKQTATDARVEQLLAILNRESLDVPTAPGTVVADAPVTVVPAAAPLTNEPTEALTPDAIGEP